MSKAVSKKASTSDVDQQVGVTGKIPAPPDSHATENLSIEIRKTVGWRLKVALFQLEVEGQPSTKKAFVEKALIAALDEFDRVRRAM